MRKTKKVSKRRADPNAPELFDRQSGSDIAALIDAITLLSSQVSQIISSDEDGLGLSEWSFLRALSTGDNLRSGQIARRLGVTRQRAAQLTNGLRKAGFLKVERSSGDNRKKDLTITQAGKTRCAALDSRLESLFSGAFTGKPGGAARMRRALRKLTSAARERSRLDQSKQAEP